MKEKIIQMDVVEEQKQRLYSIVQEKMTGIQLKEMKDTLQYYKATDNDINEHVMKHIADVLCESAKQADFVGSLVTGDEKNNNIKRPTESELDVNNNNNLNI
eukprot:420188_1